MIRINVIAVCCVANVVSILSKPKFQPRPHSSKAVKYGAISDDLKRI
jgi:hypothetical protein